MTTPIWQAPLNGAQNRLNAVDASGHLNQFLSAHPAQVIGYGNPVVRPTNGDQGYFTHATGAPALPGTDFAQAFTMSGTSIGRITVPILAFGNGADVMFSLCPDNAGTPNLSAPIAQIKVPASVITSMGAETGLENASNVFQTSAFNTQFATNFSPTIPWISPAATVHGAPSFFAAATSGNFTLLLGGFDNVGSTASAACFTVQYTGSGTVASPIPQPNLPQATFQGYAAVTPDTVVYAGGTTTAPSVNNVWSASWNPSTGVIGAWSSQTALPVAITNGSGASFGEFIYIVGGNTANTVASAVNTVYMSKVSNSQVGSWTTMSPLPRALSLPFVGVVGNWIVVAGGLDASNVTRAETYYAAINTTDGSLGPWQNGPNLFQAVDSAFASWCLGVTTSSIILYAGAVTGGGLGSYIQQLSVDPSGVAPSWNVFKNDAPGTVAMSAFTDGNGIWFLMGYNTNNTVAQNFFQTVPLVSVPFNTTGLSNGTTYWLVTQEIESGNASDYIGIGMNFGAYATDAKASARRQNSWSTFIAGTSVPLTVYDTTASTPLVHMTEDLSTSVPSTATYQRWSTLTYGQNKLLSGIIEVTMQPNVALNSNPTFTSGVSPWTATNGTITQSNAQTHGGFAFSGLLTPTGGFASAFAQSELFPAEQTFFGSTAWYLVTGFFYSTTGWANFSLSVNWFDSSRTLISTSSANVSLVANTWTQVTNFFTPPTTAAFAAIAPTESGTPGATNLLYISNTYMTLAPENVSTLASIAQVNYMTGSLWPPVGITQSN